MRCGVQDCENFSDFEKAVQEQLDELCGKHSAANSRWSEEHCSTVIATLDDKLTTELRAVSGRVVSYYA
jgi:hypothetical protein